MNIGRNLQILALAQALTLFVTAAEAPPKPNREMQKVLDQLEALGGKPIETLSASEARQQPTPADAVKALLKKEGKSTAPEPVAQVRDTTYPGASRKPFAAKATACFASSRTLRDRARKDGDRMIYNNKQGCRSQDNECPAAWETII